MSAPVDVAPLPPHASHAGSAVAVAPALTAAVVSGAFVALQQRVNGDLGRSLHDPLLAAVISFVIGLAGLLLLACQPAQRSALRRLRLVPWWSRLGGLGGASLVAVGAVAAPKIGVALLTVGLVAGSTLGGLAVDRVGLGPGGVRHVTPPRLAGAVLCLVAIGVSSVGGVRAASPLLLLLVVLAGGMTSLQQALNGRVRQATGSVTVATLVNFSAGTAVLTVALSVRGLISGVQASPWPGADHVWLYLGGPIGASFVAVAAVVVRPLGVLRLGLAVTAGQLVGAIALDAGRGVAGTTLLAAGLTMLAVLVSGLGPRRPVVHP